MKNVNIKMKNLGILLRKIYLYADIPTLSGYYNFDFCILHFAFRDFSRAKNRGYTLIETVVALAIILAALAGPISLVIRGILSFSFAKNKIIAVNLAQEGIELIRVIRENNQICLEKQQGNSGRTWQTDHDGNGNLLATGRTADAISFNSPFTCGSATIRNPIIRTLGSTCATTLLLIDTNGNYGYVSGQPTIFSRCIDIVRPSSPESGPPGSPSIPPVDMMDVTAVVSWSEHETNRTVTLTERLYNWR